MHSETSLSTWVQITDLPLTRCVALGKLLNFSVAQFLHL